MYQHTKANPSSQKLSCFALYLILSGPLFSALGQDPFGAGHACAGIVRHGSAEGHREGLERALDAVMVVVSPEHVHVQRDARHLEHKFEGRDEAGKRLR